MRRTHLFALAAALLIATIVAALWYNAKPGELAERPRGERPKLLLLTSLPIVFPEKFSLEGGGSPALDALQGRYGVEPISIADRTSLAGHRLLLMVQPQAQPAEVLVELDQWVRSGGRVLLLADPALQWPSDRPLGDPLRPPFAFADTGLLGHWGLRLDAPISLGVKEIETEGRTIRTASPGELTATAANCAIGESRLIAHCQVGKGRVAVIADADFLDVQGLRGAGTASLGLLLSQLAGLEN